MDPLLLILASTIKKYYFFTLLLITLIFILSEWPEKTLAFSPGLSLSYGKGKPDQLEGNRIALQSYWPFIGFAQSALNLTGYWDLSFAKWQVTPNLHPTQFSQPSTIRALAISPIIRLQAKKNCLLSSQPYLEIGIGTTWLSSNHLGHRNLGGQFAFQDLLGIGLRWNRVRTWSLSYHYLHYSNASILPPNQGIDVKHLLSVGYEFN